MMKESRVQTDRKCQRFYTDSRASTVVRNIWCDLRVCG